MLNFSSFITEVFLKGADTMQGYVEIWKNPTREEFRKIGNGENEEEIGAYVTAKNLYAWDRNIVQHSAIRWSLPEGERSLVPVYLHIDYPSMSVKVAVSFWNGIRIHHDDFQKTLQSHPAFRLFKKIEVLPW